MTYQVLARKYRPQGFDALVGQDALVRTLTNAFKLDRIAHAFMLSGIRGVGKTSTARLLARALNYESDKIQSPCLDFQEKGKHCQAIIDGQHPDVTEIDAASHNGVDDVRNLIEQCQYRPMAARYRVYIIDEVHMLSTQAFNALLKILEEPPAFVKFIFATTEIRKLPITILSRCQHFALRRLDAEDIVHNLQSILKLEKIEAQNEALYMIAQFSEGSMRDALSILDTAIAYNDTQVTMEVLHNIFGLTHNNDIVLIFEKIMVGQAQEALALFQQFYKNGAEPLRILQDLANFCHEICRYKMAKDTIPTYRLTEQILQKIADNASQLTLGQLDRFWQCLMQGLQEIPFSHAHLASAEMLIIRLCCLSVLPPPDDINKYLQAELNKPDTVEEKQAEPIAESITEQVYQQPYTQEEEKNIQQGETFPTPLEELHNDASQSNEGYAQIDLPSLIRFEDLLAYLESKKEIKTKLILEKDIHIIEYTQGTITLRLASHADPSIIQIIQNKLSHITNQAWQIIHDTAPGQATIYQQKEEDKKLRIKAVQESEEMIQFKHYFPNSEIVDVGSLE